jgi:hypothetical protein
VQESSDNFVNNVSYLLTVLSEKIVSAEKMQRSIQDIHASYLLVPTTVFPTSLKVCFLCSTPPDRILPPFVLRATYPWHTCGTDSMHRSQETRMIFTEEEFAAWQRAEAFPQLSERQLVGSLFRCPRPRAQRLIWLAYSPPVCPFACFRVQAVSRQFFLCFFGLHVGLMPTLQRFSNEWEGRGGR